LTTTGLNIHFIDYIVTRVTYTHRPKHHTQKYGHLTLVPSRTPHPHATPTSVPINQS